MPQLTIQQRKWVCLEMARVRNSAEVRRRWPQRFPNVRVPYRVTIKEHLKSSKAMGHATITAKVIVEDLERDI